MTAYERTLNLLIRGALNTTLLFIPAYCLAWLLLQHPPIWWHIILASEALELAIRAPRNHRRHREVRDLQNQFDQPAYGDQRPGEPTT